MKLEGKGILITGASQGLGRVIAEACVAHGANVFLCARNRQVLEQTRIAIAEKANPNQEILAQVADVSKPDQVANLVDKAKRALPRIDGLVNNAGVYGPIGLIEDVDWEQWTQAIQINLMGTVLPCRQVLPIFRRQGSGKIVNLSGGGATSPLPRFSAYSAAKAAVVRFTETLAQETLGSGIDVNAVAPGALNTRLLEEVLAAGPERAGEDFYRRALKQREEGGSPLQRGADLCTFLLSDQSNGITGRLLSAVWDSWGLLPQRRALLENTDIYTLRRIVPKDRNFDWDRS